MTPLMKACPFASLVRWITGAGTRVQALAAFIQRDPFYCAGRRQLSPATVTIHRMGALTEREADEHFAISDSSVAAVLGDTGKAVSVDRRNELQRLVKAGASPAQRGMAARWSRLSNQARPRIEVRIGIEIDTVNVERFGLISIPPAT
jgi:hypothetical protein